MYVYIQSERGLWTVGFYAPDGTWHPDTDHTSADEAAKRVHYLNGGESSLLAKAVLELETGESDGKPCLTIGTRNQLQEIT